MQSWFLQPAIMANIALRLQLKLDTAVGSHLTKSARLTRNHLHWVSKMPHPTPRKHDQTSADS